MGRGAPRLGRLPPGLLPGPWRPVGLRVPRPSRLSRRAPEPIATRAPGLATTRAAGPATMSANPAISSASTTQDIPVPSGLLNETAIECAVGAFDAEGDFDGDGDGDGDFDGDADGDGDFDGVVFFLGLPVWFSTS